MGMYGSSGTATQTTQYNYDPVASRKLADIAERAQEMSEEQWDLYKEVFEPYEREMVEINRTLLPDVAETTELSLEEQRRDLRLGREVKDTLREEQLGEIRQSRPAMQRFYKEAAEGVDVEDRMGEATSDVAQAFKAGEGNLRRSAARLGLKPTAQMIRDIALEESKAVAGARSGARRSADIENFERLRSAMSARGRSTGLPGTSVAQPITDTNVGNYGLNSPVASSLALQNQAGRSYGVLAGRVKSSTGTRSTTEKEGFGNVLANVAGVAAGYGLSRI